MKLDCLIDLNDFENNVLTSKQIQSLLFFILEFKQKYGAGIPESIEGVHVDTVQSLVDANKTSDWELDFVLLEKIVGVLSEKETGHSIWMIIYSSVALTSLYKSEHYAEQICLSLISPSYNEDFLKNALEQIELKHLNSDVTYELRYIMKNVLIFRLKQILASRTNADIASFDGVPLSWIFKLLDDFNISKTKVGF